MYLQTTSISELWYLTVIAAKKHGYRQNIDRGSFERESYRLQLPFLTASINSPLFDTIPTPPPGWPIPTTQAKCNEYYHDYILQGRTPHGNQEYTYATRIGEQLPKVMEMLSSTPGTNQATIIVGDKDDVDLEHPACLRLIDFKIVDKKLELASFWRSHDLYSGLPENLNGLAMLQRDVAEYAGVVPGKMHYASSGSHIYGFIEDIIS